MYPSIRKNGVARIAVTMARQDRAQATIAPGNRIETKDMARAVIGIKNRMDGENSL